MFGRFSSMEAAKRAKTVRWHIKMDNEVRDGLVRFLEEASKVLKPRTSNKRISIDISLDAARENNARCPPRPPWVDVQPTIFGRLLSLTVNNATFPTGFFIRFLYLASIT